METNLHLDKKTEISSPIKDAIASHIEKFYPMPRARQNSNLSTIVDTHNSTVEETK
jgi:hypothetical protein